MNSVRLFVLPKSGCSTSIRAVSSKYIKPHPRSYKRRLFEAAVAPIMPKEVKQCNIAQVLERLNRHQQEYADIELAEVKEIKRWIKEHNFRSMAVCQFLSVNGRNLWLTSNQLRLQGLELRQIDNKIAKKLFENTALAALEPLWVGHNALLFGKDIQSLKVIVTETQKYNFLIPLAITYDNRIMSMKEVEKLTDLPDLEMVRAQTTQILDQIPVQLTQALNHHGEQLSTILSQISTGNQETK
uniref:Ribosomal protein L10 n=1 Tax=Panagrolaimus sp. JU765 TaxID=591449 RepID=A0AC34RTP3_9BILA